MPRRLTLRERLAFSCFRMNIFLGQTSWKNGISRKHANFERFPFEWCFHFHITSKKSHWTIDVLQRNADALIYNSDYIKMLTADPRAPLPTCYACRDCRRLLCRNDIMMGHVDDGMSLISWRCSCPFDTNEILRVPAREILGMLRSASVWV